MTKIAFSRTELRSLVSLAKPAEFLLYDQPCYMTGFNCC